MSSLRLFLLMAVLGTSAGCFLPVVLMPDMVAKHFVTYADVSPKQETEMALINAHHRILRYWEQHGTLPQRIDDLPLVENRSNSLLDGWGRSLLLESDGVRYVTVSSLGEDGVDGGEGDNATISRTFDTMEAISGEYYAPLEWQRVRE